jgi:hypothetical protein
MHTKSWSENLKGRDHSEDPGVDTKKKYRIHLKEIRWEDDWIHLAQNRDQSAGSCEDGNEPSGSIKGGKFLD